MAVTPGHTGLLRGWVRVVRPCAAATQVTTVVMVLFVEVGNIRNALVRM